MTDPMRILESLTPGGSEYVGDPERCAAYIRDRQEQQHRLILKLSKERKIVKPKPEPLEATNMNEPESIVLTYGRCEEDSCGTYGVARYWTDGSYKVIIPACWHKQGAVVKSSTEIREAIAKTKENEHE